METIQTFNFIPAIFMEVNICIYAIRFSNEDGGGHDDDKNLCVRYLQLEAV
jgi:hypothetical protein